MTTQDETAAAAERDAITALQITLLRLDPSLARGTYRISDGVLFALADQLIGAMAKNGLLESLLTAEQSQEYVQSAVSSSDFHGYVRRELETIIAATLLHDVQPGE